MRGPFVVRNSGPLEPPSSASRRPRKSARLTCSVHGLGFAWLWAVVVNDSCPRESATARVVMPASTASGETPARSGNASCQASGTIVGCDLRRMFAPC
jgi:hypothetical protein